MSEQPTPVLTYEWDLLDRLHKALRIAQIKPGEMAAVLGVSRNTVGNYLAGRTVIKDGALRSWAMRCGVRFEWLRDGVGSPVADPDGPGTQGRSTPACVTAAVEDLIARRQRPTSSAAPIAA